MTDALQPRRATTGTAFPDHAGEEWSRDRMEEQCLLPEPGPADEVLVRVRGLEKSFGPRRILRGLDLDVIRGETLVILGSSGSGKTTLIRHLMAMMRSDQGTVQVARAGGGWTDLGRAPEPELALWRRRLGVVFQGAALLNSLTVLENVGLPLVEVDRRPPHEVHERVVRALRRVYLPAEEILQLKPANLSGGMRKRVGLARAIIQEPAVILYDEPTTGLDPVTVAGVNELTLELQRTLAVTSVVITHDLGAAFQVADRIAMLYKGRIVALGSKSEIRANQHPVLQQMLRGSTTGPLTEVHRRSPA